MRRLVVVGNGMAGMACVEQILKYDPQFHITVFGDETHVNYNRVMLSAVLAGEKQADEIIINSEEWYRRNEIELRRTTRCCWRRAARRGCRRSRASTKTACLPFARSTTRAS